MEKVTAFSGTTIPANYDKYLGPFLFEHYALDLVSRLQDKKYDKILEIACGTGRVTNHLSQSVDHDEIVATDLNPDMISVAQQKVKSQKVMWMAADALDLPFVDNEFDLVVCQFGIMFFPDKLKGLKETYRVLKPGGRLIFSTWDKPENIPAMFAGRKIIESYFDNDPPKFYGIPFSMADPAELKELTIQAGFNKVIVESVLKQGEGIAADLTIGIVEGNPIYLTICEKDPALIQVIKEKVEKTLKDRFGEPVKSPLMAWVTEGIK